MSHQGVVAIDLTCKKTNCVQYASLHFCNIRRDGLLSTISGHQQTVRPPGRGVMAARLFTATIICGLLFTTDNKVGFEPGIPWFRAEDATATPHPVMIIKKGTAINEEFAPEYATKPAKPRYACWELAA
ncbi:hypothetical protein Bbelb_019170 [Branchiostoma belcheri]|nr:hypothetical protein Bbelb_019170 [Branchiostoma belcheri]